MLGMSACADWKEVQDFVLTTQDSVTGGLSKWPDNHPDPLHTYLGLSGLALADPPLGYALRPVDPALNITLRAKQHLDDIYKL